MSFVIDFLATGALERGTAGGKGANLAAMCQAGFAVPRGFVVTTDAFASMFDGEPGRAIAAMLAAVDYDDAASVERQSQRVRELAMAAGLPGGLRSEIERAYAGLGNGVYVAVRSSGTAEDLAEASFAGQHDTYLDIVGSEAVVDAVRRCWASLWTARAVSYRHKTGMDRGPVRLAVVVQEMVPAEVAGVMFTANPFSGATDEIVINASWGLGEGVVSGILQPDQFTLHKPTLASRGTVTGGKELKVVRDPGSGIGTVQVETSSAERESRCLEEQELRELAELGRRVEHHYGGMPQDIEWAYAQGRFYLLQARDVTGTAFSWDEELDAWQPVTDNPETIWTRAFADEYWTGAVTPLFYSVRARENSLSYYRSVRLWGWPEMASIRIHRYFEAEAYTNTANHAAVIRNTMPKALRVAGSPLDYLPPSMRPAVAAAPFSLLRYLRMHLRIALIDRTQGIRGWIRRIEHYVANEVPRANGLDQAQLQRLSDEELKRHIDQRIAFFEDLLYDMWTGFVIHGTAALQFLGVMLGRWYRGDNAMIFADLITGLPQRTITLTENLLLWDLAHEIRVKPELMQLFAESQETTFFQRLEAHPAGAKASSMYRELLAEHGHRGHADRDFWYPRRAEDPGIDFRALKVLLTSDGTDRPDTTEEKLIAKREAATREVLACFGGGLSGWLKRILFTRVHRYALDFLVIRDDERHYVDRATFSKKRAFCELGRRLFERGQIDASLDFYFLSKEELYELLEGRASKRQVAAKIAGRRRNFDRFDTKEYIPPLYLRGREEFEATARQATAEGATVLNGLSVSRGSVSGRARVVRELRHIDRLQRGEILITNSTDPGWTPVFSLIGGLVLETGGLLSHGACLSREYSLPALTLANATRLIPDGALITLDGSAGRISVDEIPGADPSLR